MNQVQIWRLITRIGFFVVFVTAPVLNVFRLDLYEGNFLFFGMDWTLDIRDGDAADITFNLITRAFLPLASVVLLISWVSYKFGRIYCGWLCPHYSVVETINYLMRRSIGKPTVWARSVQPAIRSDGVETIVKHQFLPLTMVAIIFFAALWAISLLTYLLPPTVIWGNVFRGELTHNQFLFISVATTLFVLEFTLARHLFCRFGCAVGLFQSLVWMANRKARAVSFNRARAIDCVGCDKSCELACPMMLKPRREKRKMFSCTQCLQCVQACDRVQENTNQESLLVWRKGI
ncbi:MAG: 4Fe-4S binding protein [Pseudomonadales bacterium]|nr:4Fe-4S binding protein [Pseudomonadales bacterium]